MQRVDIWKQKELTMILHFWLSDVIWLHSKATDRFSFFEKNLVN